MFFLKSLKLLERGASDKTDEEVAVFKSYINVDEKMSQRQQKLDLYCGVCFLGEQLPLVPDESKLNPMITCEKK